MLKTLISVIFNLFIFTASAELSIEGIFQNSKKAYNRINTYQSSGEVKTDVNGTKLVTEFKMIIKKPGLYKIGWLQSIPGLLGKAEQSGVTWNAGEQSYLYLTSLNSYMEMNSDTMAIGAATGISGGAAMTIPSMLLKFLKKPQAAFEELQEPIKEDSQTVEGEECYVISGSTHYSKKISFWFSKETFLIRKTKRLFAKPESSNQKNLEVSDDDLKKAIAALGQEVSKESIEHMRKLLQKSNNVISNTALSGSTEEVHHKISTKDLDEKEFTFKLPDGALLRSTLFENMAPHVHKH